MFLRNLLLGLTAALVAACAGVSEPPVSGPVKQRIELHKRTDKPIHIGDGGGNLSDFTADERAPNPRSFHEWTFNLTELPTVAVIDVAMYSLTSFCPTVLAVNSHDVRDLATSGASGLGVMTEVKVVVPKDKFVTGTNVLSISEKLCGGGGLNDSLIRTLIITLH
ncbi:MAG: hypothetical protein Q7W02_11285 [Candidatus Rokubacteria bacterium]|nr:hypothetical protein [Candidatus Rokubacteria bacterium]